MRSNIVRTASGASLPVSTVISVLPPAAHELVLEAELVEAPSDDEVDEIVHREALACVAPQRTCRLCRFVRLERPVVEARREKEDDRTRLPYAQHVLEMDQRERRLARAEHELAALLERDARRPLNQVRHRAGGDRSE